MSESGIFSDFPDLAEIVKMGAVPVCEKPVVMIAMTPRTGSTHLCDVLATEPRISMAGEIFNPRGPVPMYKAQRGVRTFADYIASFSRDPGDCFMFKATWHDFAFAESFYRRLFPGLKIVYLDRQDVVAQAVSFYRARESGVWHLPAGASPNEHPTAPDICDIAAINQTIELLEGAKRDWHRFFATESLKPKVLCYEDFAANVRSGTRFFSDVLGFEPAPLITPGLGKRRLADAVSDAWAAKVRTSRWESSVEADRRFHAAWISGAG